MTFFGLSPKSSAFGWGKSRELLHGASSPDNLPGTIGAVGLRLDSEVKPRVPASGAHRSASRIRWFEMARRGSMGRLAPRTQSAPNLRGSCRAQSCWWSMGYVWSLPTKCLARYPGALSFGGQ
jgi:hypothetical protein